MSSAIAGHFDRVQERMRAACERSGRSLGDVTLVAVSKYRPIEQTRELYDLGIRHFGESRVQEGREKIPEFPGGITWHLIGHLQTNKAKYLPGLFTWVHSVDSAKVAAALEKAYARQGEVVNALVEVNVSGEESKHGAGTREVLEVVRSALDAEHINLQGLMTMAPYFDDPERTRPVFRALRELAEKLRAETGASLPHLSMGMTNDFEIAIEEGATMVRVGTALYEG